MTTSVSMHKGIQPPTSARPTALDWIKINLFSSWLNTLLTLFSVTLIYVILRGALGWAFTEANWAVIPAKLRLLLVGQYPSAVAGEVDYVWRVSLCLYILAAIIGLHWGASGRSGERYITALALLPVLMALIPVVYHLAVRPEGHTLGAAFLLALQILALDLVGLVGWLIGRWRGRRFIRLAAILWILYFPLVIVLVRGFGADYREGITPFASVPTRLWGGLLLSLLLAIVGIVFSFPIGVALALGRRSKLVVIRALSVIYIEFIRGVPLISLLFIGSLMLNLFMPSGISFDGVVRAMVVITLFSAAYLAENVRGGLQCIPKGQYEAASAIGLGGFQTMFFIILPQALRAVIPVMMGQFIGLFKDTSLVAIVGLLDLLGIAGGVIADPNYLGTQREVLLFISLFYFAFSYALSYTSRRIETNLGVGTR